MVLCKQIEHPGHSVLFYFIWTCCKWPTLSVVYGHPRTGVGVPVSPPEWLMVGFHPICFCLVKATCSFHCSHLTWVNTDENEYTRECSEPISSHKPHRHRNIPQVFVQHIGSYLNRTRARYHDLSRTLLTHTQYSTPLYRVCQVHFPPCACTLEPRSWLEPSEWGKFGQGHCVSVCRLCLCCQKYFMVAWAKLDPSSALSSVNLLGLNEFETLMKAQGNVKVVSGNRVINLPYSHCNLLFIYIILTIASISWCNSNLFVCAYC